jgi:hypothetical protein
LDVTYGAVFFQCVYLLCVKEAAVMAAGAAARKAFELDTPPYMPHLSLLYSDIDPSNRQVHTKTMAAAWKLSIQPNCWPGPPPFVPLACAAKAFHSRFHPDAIANGRNYRAAAHLWRLRLVAPEGGVPRRPAHMVEHPSLLMPLTWMREARAAHTKCPTAGCGPSNCGVWDAGLAGRAEVEDHGWLGEYMVG